MSIPTSLRDVFIGANAAGGYVIDDSLRFRGAQKLTRTPSTAGNRKRWTLSVWMKIGWSDTTTSNTNYDALLSVQGAAADTTFNRIYFRTGDLKYGAYSSTYRRTDAYYRDVSAWYHYVIQVDTAAASEADRIKLWVNGVRDDLWETNTKQSLASVTQNQDLAINQSGVAHDIGYDANDNDYGNFYLAEYHLVDGTALDSTDFGEYNDDGVWVPKKYSGSHGTNGFYLDFSDPSNIGADRSGNGNNFTATGFELSNTASHSYDWMADSPTSNIPTINPLTNIGGLSSTISQIYPGNLLTNSNGNTTLPTTMAMPAGTGKWYWEINIVVLGASSNMNFGVQRADVNRANYTNWTDTKNNGVFVNTNNVNNTYIYGSASTTTAWTVATADVIGIALDATTGNLSFYKNGTLQVTLSGAVNTNYPHYPACSGYSSQDLPGYNYGQQPWKQTPPSGYVGLVSSELPDVDIKNPSDHFQTIHGQGPSGSGSPQGIKWRTSSSGSTDATSLIYGKTAMDNNNNILHPMFQWALSLEIGGFTDWYIPAYWEMDILYRNLRPSSASNITGSGSPGANNHAVPQAANYTTTNPGQTSASAFQTGGSEAFSAANWYWNATQWSGGSGYGWYKSFDTITIYASGYTNVNVKTANYYARAIRRVPYTGSEPSIGASYEGGYFAGLIDAKSSPDGTATHALIVAPKDGGEYGVGNGILDQAKAIFPNGLWWIKDRANANQHQLVDSVRGGSLAIRTPSPTTEASYSAPSGNSVAWSWNAPDSFTSSAGSISTSGRRNTTAGFSIISFSGNGTNGATIGHGLSQAPEFVIVFNRKQTNSTYSFAVAHPSLAANEYLTLNTSFAKSSGNNYWNSTRPGASVITLGPDATVNSSGQDMICYAWHSVPGYSAFGNYPGNGSADGPFIYTGFRPAFVMIKRANSASSWIIMDTDRNEYNPASWGLFPDSTEDENSSTSYYTDFLSNGFKLRTSAWPNTSGGDYIYMAFAEHPFAAANVSPSPAR